METFDLIILGGGRASNLAIAAAKAGLRTALIERDRLGGACPNRGCVPSKLLIGFAEAARHVREAGRHFIDADLKDVDLARIFKSVNEYVGGVDARYQARVDEAGVELIRGEGRFTGVREIRAAGRFLTAPRIVVATGSRPAPPMFPALPVWTSDDLFPLESPPPRSVLVIGGGVIACEMAAMFSALGIRTTLFARGGRLLPKEDSDIENIFQTEFSRETKVHLHATLRHLVYDGRGFHATFDIGGRGGLFHAERVLFATGRIPNTESLALTETGVSVDGRGFIPVDAHLETSVPGIHATGDVNGRQMLQHAAAFEIQYLRNKFLKGTTASIDEEPLGHAVFSHPEVAAVGLTEDQLKERGIPYLAVLEDWLASARTMGLRIGYPRVKLLVSPADHSILGCHLVGPESATLIHQVITVMRLKNDVRELAETIYVHPALNECLLAAAVKAVSAVKKANAGN